MSSIAALVDRDLLAAVAGPAPSAKKARQAEIIQLAAAALPSLLDRYAINTAARIAQFLGQVAHESDGFCTTREYADGSAYEGRRDLGNVHPGDGKRYPGRGIMQLTGRANHRAFTAWARTLDPSCPDFEQQPELVEQFPWAALVAVYFWTVNGLNPLADRNDLLGITRKINGGRNGLEDRQRREAIAERYLAAKLAVTAATAEGVSSQQSFAVLYRGIKDRDEDVADLQRLLAEAGYYHLAIDGDFGAGTEGAVKAFQSRLKLKVDGIAGKQTLGALRSLLNIKSAR